MPRFGIKAQFTLIILALMSIPWVGVSYWQEIQQTALNAQARIQEIEAKAIATSLLATQENIRELLAPDENGELQKHSLSAPSINNPIRLDGVFGDWPQKLGSHTTFDYDKATWLANPDETSETAFSLHLAQSSQYLFMALSVRDNRVMYRKPTHLRLDYNDHIQLTFQDENALLRRVLIPAEREGSLASYFSDEQWQYGRDLVMDEQLVASHKTGIQGYWRRTSEGYAVEMRIPTDKLNTLQPQLRLVVVDVDENPAYGPQAIVASLPKHFKDELNPVGLHAREFQRAIDKLKHTYARLWIYDSRGREWAFAEREPQGERVPYAFDSQCVRDALSGIVPPLDQITDSEGKLSRLVVCYPIQEDSETLGVVVIDESADHVLKKEEQRVKVIAIKVAGALALVMFLLFAYAFMLGRRISRLSHEAKESIDSHGRIERTIIHASSRFPDEIGDLSRSMSTLLEKQQSYMHFLERIPQTLRHEIANPLNKLRTSVENLLDQKPELSEDKYIKKVEAGIDQITKITLHLTEAASLESAIQNEQLHKLDLVQFINRYHTAWEESVIYEQRIEEPAWIQGDSSRLEQLFDKLMENAASFCSETGHVYLKLAREQNRLVVSVENDGPLLPTESTVELFSPMVSTRSTGSSIHLGLGLHIAKLICDHHKAKLVGRNREDKTGVVFSVEFNLI